MAEPIKAEVLANWMPPDAALAMARAALGSTYLAAHGLIQRLAGGLVTAGAASALFVDHGRETRGQNVAVPKGLWGELRGPVENHGFWQTGDGGWWLNDDAKVVYYGLRFDAAAIRAWLDTISPAPASAPEPEPGPPPLPEKPEEEARPGQVAKALLEEWFALFQKANPDAPEALAVKSARAMFPGKAISRERVRALLGPRKRGRKTKSGTA